MKIKYTVGVAGLGLIGGSMVKALKKKGYTVIGYDINEDVTASALACGINASTDAALLACADMIFIALYPRETVDFVKNNVKFIKKDAVIIDCCGVKEYVCTELNTFAAESGFVFIGGHPMTGIEKSGFEASSAAIFENASFIITPNDATPQDAIDKAAAVIMDAGFGSITISTPSGHDRMIAFTSQLPHCIACAYVKSPSCASHKGFSSGSFKDVSRVAHLNPTMWAQLFLDNKEQLLSEIDIFEQNLNELRNCIKNGNFETLRQFLKTASDIKDSV